MSGPDTPSPGRNRIDYHPCTRCHVPMTITRTKVARLGFERRTFECSNCNAVETVTAKTAAYQWMDSGLSPPN